MSTSQVAKVAAGVLIDRQKILIARRKKGSHLEGKWEFPGGKIESGETPQECLRREFFEELGLIVRVEEFISSHIHNYPTKSIELIAHTLRLESGAIKLVDHDIAEWVSASELSKYDFAEADLPIVKIISEL